MGANARAALDPRWTRHFKGVTSSFQVAKIRVTRRTLSDTLVYNQQTSQYETGGVVTVWEGMARVQPYGIIGDVIDAQDTTGRRLMRVQIQDMSAGITLDDTINILTCDNDPELCLYQLEVRGAIGSSNSWLRDLVCEANLKTVQPLDTVLNLTSPSNLTSTSNLTQG